MAGGEWWATHFDAQYLREYEPIFSAARDRREVARLMELLGLPVDTRILDVPCGHGRHTGLLAEAGYDVTGLDHSAYLLGIAQRRRGGRTPRYARSDMRPLQPRYVRGDMRGLPARWSARFGAVINLYTSFGFFLDPADDVRTIGEFARVLEPGGVFVWHGASRDGVMARFLGRDWWVTKDGTLIAHEREFDALSGVLTVRASWRGRRDAGEREHRIRLYTATRLAELCAASGLIVEEAFDGWSTRPLSRRASEMLLIARRE